MSTNTMKYLADIKADQDCGQDFGQDQAKVRGKQTRMQLGLVYNASTRWLGLGLAWLRSNLITLVYNYLLTIISKNNTSNKLFFVSA